MKTYVAGVSYYVHRSNVTQLEPHQIFVFGSNRQGRHGKGAALAAKKHFGAEYGNGYGRQGQSYAICTKELRKDCTPVFAGDIRGEIRRLYRYAMKHPSLEFIIPYKSTSVNLNGFLPKQMAEMFATALPSIPSNIIFADDFALLVLECQMVAVGFRVKRNTSS